MAEATGKSIDEGLKCFFALMLGNIPLTREERIKGREFYMFSDKRFLTREEEIAAIVLTGGRENIIKDIPEELILDTRYLSDQAGVGFECNFLFSELQFNPHLQSKLTNCQRDGR